MIKNLINYVLSWQSIRSSVKSIKPPTTSDHSLAPALNFYYASKIRVNFTGSCLKQDKITFNPGKVVNIYIVY